MNAESKRRPLCRCCESEPGILGDPHLGPVCSDSYAELTATRVMLAKLGPGLELVRARTIADRFRPTRARDTRDMRRHSTPLV